MPQSGQSPSTDSSFGLMLTSSRPRYHLIRLVLRIPGALDDIGPIGGPLGIPFLLPGSPYQPSVPEPPEPPECECAELPYGVWFV